MALTDSFEAFLSELKQKVNLGKDVGMSQAMMADRAKAIGDWLAASYEPKNPEQRLLKELWDVSDAKEREAIAHAMFKLVERKVPARRS
ncbi:MAG: DUF3243 domain-containing protein [Clostridia bacterium]|nr:DUF3243 domain-containing protein [Clostridia bacterium]